MLNPDKVKLAIAPIGWTNDDMPDLGAENTFEQCISEMALAGFKGSEIGNKYPKDPDVLKKYLDLLFKEINIIKPKIIITFGNQVSSIILNKKISVSENRKKCHKIEINKNKYKVYPVYYPVGNGIFNINKSIEDIKWIIENEIK